MSVDAAQFCLCKNPISCLSSMKKERLPASKYVNTAEIISKVTMTLSLINSNKCFDFVG